MMGLRDERQGGRRDERGRKTIGGQIMVTGQTAASCSAKTEEVSISK